MTWLCLLWAVAVNPTLQTHFVADEPALVIIDQAGKKQSVTATEFGKLARRKVKATDYANAETEFEGVTLADLLQSAGVVFGKELKGKGAATVVVLEASDGYRIPITLLEIDPGTTEQVVLVADQRDGKPLSEKEGPFRLVIPGDKRQIRWIRMVRTIRLVNLQELPLIPTAPKDAAK
ncbi:molybdopterin-dependent oxidoreductase [Anatilimnocola floriformis]|uniref:molybdopterin-dependent oxidoreductase n=1 Tax=Anatilimnocola floriformis TaxID=2948575 RepID=UPI0020C53E26|nr:molybdopterin-dependent oxidoreductase [Anatilimnocola floriformis]